MVAVIGTLIYTFTAKSFTDTMYAQSFQYDLSGEVLENVNKYREKQHLAPLVQNPLICDLAISRSVEISTDYSHDQFLSRFSTPGYIGYITNARFSENISKNILTGEAVVNAWINSPTHKELLDSEFEYGCISCYQYGCVLNTVSFVDEKTGELSIK